MKFRSNFTDAENGKLFSTCFPEDSRDGESDIFEILFDQWNDAEYLESFFLPNERILANSFWRGMSIDDAIDQVIRLYAIELEDGTLLITGGTIKLTENMIGENFDKEIRRLKRVQAYLKKEGIFSRDGLIEK